MIRVSQTALHGDRQMIGTIEQDGVAGDPGITANLVSHFWLEHKATIYGATLFG
jgi:hypothetical protein